MRPHPAPQPPVPASVPTPDTLQPLTAVTLPPERSRGQARGLHCPIQQGLNRRRAKPPPQLCLESRGEDLGSGCPFSTSPALTLPQPPLPSAAAGLSISSFLAKTLQKQLTKGRAVTPQKSWRMRGGWGAVTHWLFSSSAGLWSCCWGSLCPTSGFCLLLLGRPKAGSQRSIQSDPTAAHPHPQPGVLPVPH